MSSHELAITNSRVSETSQPVKKLLSYEYEYINTSYDPTYRALWCTLKTSKTPTFSLALLKNIRGIQDNIAQYCYEKQTDLLKYIIWQSDSDDIFNLGIDLPYVFELISTRNEQKLEDYLQLCIDVFYINLVKLNISPLITISVIRGKAYGGGFEAAISSDIIIAERNARCSFPEIRYNILPTLCTLNMLLRRFSPTVVESLLFQGKTVNAETMLEMNLVDKVVDVGSGKKTVMDKIQQIHPRHSAYSDLYTAKTFATKVTYDELNEFRKMWVNTALRLSKSNVSCLERLAKAQARLIRMK